MSSGPIGEPARLETSGAPAYRGRYVVLDEIGAGGMAVVYRAEMVGPEGFRRVVALKVLRRHLCDDPEFLRMFIDEARICGCLLHPNIVQVFELGCFSGSARPGADPADLGIALGSPSGGESYFITMEYVDGLDLRALLRSDHGLGFHPLPPPIAADIARQVCLGLDHAHALGGEDGQPLGIIHRDISPSNIMVAANGSVKILDFGIARAAGHLRRELTDRGTVKGKFAYLAPEQLTEQAIDSRVDIFALGIVLHEALAGRRLFAARSALHALQLLQEMTIPPPSAVNSAVPAALDRIVLRALERDPERRYQTAGDMADELESFLLEARHSAQALTRFMRVRRAAGNLEALRTPPLRNTGHASSTSSSAARSQVSMTTLIEEQPQRARRHALAVAGLAIVGAAVFAFVWGTRPPESKPPLPLGPPAATPVIVAPLGPVEVVPSVVGERLSADWSEAQLPVQPPPAGTGLVAASPGAEESVSAGRGARRHGRRGQAQPDVTVEELDRLAEELLGPAAPPAAHPPGQTLSPF